MSSVPCTETIRGSSVLARPISWGRAVSCSRQAALRHHRRTDPGGGYAELLEGSEILDIGGRPVRVLKLEKLIEIKRSLNRPKDKLMLIHLEATLEEREKLRGKE